MNKEQALQIVSQACASVVADLATHQKIQEALSVLASVPKQKVK